LLFGFTGGGRVGRSRGGFWYFDHSTIGRKRSVDPVRWTGTASLLLIVARMSMSCLGRF
jgi:hypothetical protein